MKFRLDISSTKALKEEEVKFKIMDVYDIRPRREEFLPNDEHELVRLTKLSRKKLLSMNLKTFSTMLVEKSFPKKTKRALQGIWRGMKTDASNIRRHRRQLTKIIAGLDETIKRNYSYCQVRIKNRIKK